MDAEQLTQELSLKAMTALSNIIGDYERGLISKAQAATGCRAVFDTVGGLVGTEVFNLVSAAAQQYKGAKSYEVTIGRGDDRYKGVMRQCGEACVLDFTINGGTFALDSETGARAKFEECSKRITK